MNQPEFSSLQTILVNSRIQSSNNALYQVIKELISRVGQFQSVTVSKLQEISTSVQEMSDTIEEITSGFPVGSIFISVNPADPNSQLGYGSWVRFAKGRVLVGLDESDTDFDTVEEIGGEKKHVLTPSEVP
jgi:hypothetical protein